MWSAGPGRRGGYGDDCCLVAFKQQRRRARTRALQSFHTGSLVWDATDFRALGWEQQSDAGDGAPADRPEVQRRRPPVDKIGRWRPAATKTS